MGAQYTPPPWSTYVNTLNDVAIIKRFPDGQESHEIARCKSGFENARLITAAPELLNQAIINRGLRAALVELLLKAGFQEDSSAINMLSCMNFDAIAKATGSAT